MKIKKILSLIICMAMVLSNTVVAFAQDEIDGYMEKTVIQPRYMYINQISSFITNGTGNLTAVVTIYISEGFTAKTILYIQESSDNENWSTIKTSNLIETNNTERVATFSTNQIKSGYYYRVKAYVRIYENNSYKETAYHYSASKKV